MNGSVFPFNVACLVIGVRPLIRHALRRATFPVGEGDLRRGRSLTFPWGKVPPQRRKRGGTSSDTVPPHTRHAYGVPPSPRRG